MLDIDTKQVAKPILCDTYTLIHINQSSVIVFLNNLIKLHKIIQYNDHLSNIIDTHVPDISTFDPLFFQMSHRVLSPHFFKFVYFILYSCN